MKKISFIFLSVCFSCNLYAQQLRDITRDSIVKILQATLPETYSFSVYAQTDRSVYYAGETIYWKLYLINRWQTGKWLQKPSLSATLFNQQDSLIQEVKISDLTDYNNTFMKLPDSLHTGFYTFAILKESSESDRILYQKTLQIHPKRDYNIRSTEDYEVKFYPEGGKLLGGTACRVAFRTENAKKQPVDISGHLQNIYGDTCAFLSGSHGGIGSFSFVPRTGVDYFLVCRNTENLQKICPLPKVQPTGETLTAGWKKDVLIVSRKTGKDVDRKAVRYLSVCSEQELLYWNKWNPDKECFFFQQAQLPDGLLRLVLYDDSLHVVSKRFVFSEKGKSLAHTTVHLDKRDLTGPVKQLSGDIKVTDQTGKPLECDLSISITTSSDSSEYKLDGSLWRTCCLPTKGWNFNPSLFSYMGEEGTLSACSLDDLMLTFEPDQEKTLRHT